HVRGRQRSLLPTKTAKPLEGNTVEGEVVRVTYQSEDSGFRVLRVEVAEVPEPVVVVGFVPAAAPGTRVRATGKWEQDRKHGAQFRADTLLTVAPSTMEGLERYLGSGVIHGIGPAYAKRIVEAFGVETLQ